MIHDRNIGHATRDRLHRILFAIGERNVEAGARQRPLQCSPNLQIIIHDENARRHGPLWRPTLLHLRRAAQSKRMPWFPRPNQRTMQTSQPHVQGWLAMRHFGQLYSFVTLPGFDPAFETQMLAPSKATPNAPAPVG